MNIELDEIVSPQVADEVLEVAARGLALFSSTMSVGCRAGHYCD
jgi:hypothetical protein